MAWYSTFDGVFFITLVTVLTTFTGLVLKYCLKSKCDDVSCCWGFLKINRNVNLEVEEEMKQMEMGVKRNESIISLDSPPKIPSMEHLK